jgi:putative hydrolase of the HAD superfamily
MRDSPKLIFAADEIFEKIGANPIHPSGAESVRYEGFEFRPLGRMGQFQTSPFAYLDNDYHRLMALQKQTVKTIWLNPASELAPVPEPIHDADIVDIAELVERNGQLHHPTVAQCEAWWKEWDLPENIRRHVRRVARAAYVLAVLLRREGLRVDPILTHRGGLMHDIDKIATLHQGHQHGRVGAEFVANEGYPEVAEIVLGHNLDTIMKPGAEKRPWEINLVFFCDKLVEGDRIVPLDERFSALEKRYPKFMQLMAPSKDRVMAMSDRICSLLSLSGHEQLVTMLKDLQG